MERDHNGDGKFKKALVGLAPARVPIREAAERLSVGPATDGTMLGTAIVSATGVATMDSHKRNEIRFINAEALTPAYEPDMYGGEAIKGGPRPGHADVAGKLAPDVIEQNVALGNQHASFKWIDFETTFNPYADTDSYKAKFNANQPIEKQSQNWRVRPQPVPPGFVTFMIQREQTPEEARATMRTDEKSWEDNNYHGAILRSSENQRWVTAMDVAIGQAVSIDDPDWRDLLTRMADWKLSREAFKGLAGNPNYRRLEEINASAVRLIEASKAYYQSGAFPPESVVPLATMPPLVTSETTAQQENPPSPPPAPAIDWWNFSGMSR